MSRSISPRATRHDWAALLRAAEDADRPISDEELDLWKRGLLDGTARLWNAEYVNAAQKALEGRNPIQLLNMLDAEIPCPRFLGPVIADVLRVMAHGTIRGRPQKLTALADSAIRHSFDRRTSAYRQDASTAMLEIANARNVSVDTIRRSLKRTA